jgi:hypothetical protein
LRTRAVRETRHPHKGTTWPAEQCCGSELIFFGFGFGFGSTNYFFRIRIRIRIRILILIF